MNSIGFLFIVIYGFYCKAAVILMTPEAGNCGDDTELTCETTSNFTSWEWFGVGQTLINYTINPTPDKYTPSIKDKKLSLIIHNTTLSDQGEYKCHTGWYESEAKVLQIECKASSASVDVDGRKHASIIIDKLYPPASSIKVALSTNESSLNASGGYTCSNSSQYAGYFRCKWMLNYPLAEDSYTYTVVVTTITKADPVTGYFLIARPYTPVFSNVYRDDDNQEILYGYERVPLIIECTSRGGSPVPNILLYKDNMTFSNILAANISGGKEDDGTFTVTLRHTVTPTLEEDRKTFICRSYYPEADTECQASNNMSVVLVVGSKPSLPSVTQVLPAVAGGTIKVKCSTSNARPVASILWIYQGLTYNGTEEVTFGPSVNTYTTQSVLSLSVNIEDDGRTVRCIVKHPALTNPSYMSTSIYMQVQYPPIVSVHATNTSVEASKTTLICKANGNPNTGYSYGKWKQSWLNYGVVFAGSLWSHKLDIPHLTYEHSGIYTCSASNGIKAFGTEQEYMEGSVYILVKSFPIIIKPRIDPSQTETISGNLNGQATKEFEYYSNADITTVRCFKSVNGTRQNSNVCTTFHQDTMIDLPVFSHVVTTAGVKLTLSIPIDSEDDFGLYDVVVKNEIGSVVLKLEVIQQGTEQNKTERLCLRDEDISQLTLSHVMGVVSGLTAVVLISIFIVVLLKRRGKEKNRHQQKPSRSTEMLEYDDTVSNRRSRNSESDDRYASGNASGHAYSDINEANGSNTGSSTTYHCLYTQVSLDHSYTSVAQVERPRTDGDVQLNGDKTQCKQIY